MNAMHHTPGELYTGGLTKNQIRTRLKTGELTRLTHDILVWGTPTPEQALIHIINQREDTFATGLTLQRLLDRDPLKFPLHIAVENTTIKPNSFIKPRRYKKVVSLSQQELAAAGLSGLRAEVPIAAARLLDRPIPLIENYYGGRKGKQLLTAHLLQFDRTPPGIAALLNEAAIGADSVPERVLVRKLRKRGIKVSCNYRVDDYLWDIKIDDYLIVIDVDGHLYHSATAEHYDTFVTDRWKTNAANSLGYVTFRYPAKCVTEVPDTILDQIIDAMAFARRRPRMFDKLPRFLRGVRSWHPNWHPDWAIPYW